MSCSFSIHPNFFDIPLKNHFLKGVSYDELCNVNAADIPQGKTKLVLASLELFSQYL